ncbi:MAG: M48 family metalloprotease [Betaproteobacteria bacterium]|nr:M48 family metalloprotease [Betaproteobacteria bacterium]
MTRRLSAALAALLLTACASLPSPEVDRKIGQETAKNVEEQIGLIDDKALNEYLERVGQRVAAALPSRQFTYKFTVVDQIEPNAFAVPGGYVYVSRGLLALAKSEDEIAGVLAHEIQHVERRHSVKQMRKEFGLGLLALPGQIVGGIVSEDLATLAGKPFEAVAAGYSRDQEREADTLGQPLAAAAGYDPKAMANILDRMERFIGTLTNEKRSPSFFDSHPTTPERVGTLNQRAASITPAPAKPVAPNEAAFYKRLDGLLVGMNPSEGLVKDESFLHPDLGFRIVFPKGWAVDNSHTAVAAMSPDKKGVAVLGIAGKGEAADLPKIATAFSDKLAKQYRTKPSEIVGTTAGGLPARAIYVTDTSGKEPMHLYFLWIVLKGNVYQMIGIGPESHRPLVKAVADSLRPLTDAERASITEMRLRIVPAKAGEDLAAVSKRAEGSLALPVLAAMNGLPAGAKFRGGELVKVAVKRPHKAPAK